MRANMMVDRGVSATEVARITTGHSRLTSARLPGLANWFKRQLATNSEVHYRWRL